MHKDFVIKLANMLKDSGIKDTCLNFIHEHPEMFDDTISGDKKVMSVIMSVAIVADKDKIATDQGFITITLDKDNYYSEHFKHNVKLWNNEKINADEHYKLGKKKWLVDHPMGTDLENEMSGEELSDWLCTLPDNFSVSIDGIVVVNADTEWLGKYIQTIDHKNGCVPYEEDGIIHLWVGGTGMEGKDIVIQK